MQIVDWIILFSTLLLVVFYGYWKTRGIQSLDSYMLGNNSLPWWSVGLSIMATQASAITFLSTPGQAYEDGMRFLQFYFGLPLAMIILSVTAVPLYKKLKVYTAYEYLETRFDLKVRTLAAILFLFLRGISVGITIYAPALILSTILDWDIRWTSILIGTLVMLYSVSGGTRAVSLTQKYQLTIVMAGMLIAGGIAYSRLPENINFTDTFRLAGSMGKMNLINTDFNLSDRYNIWSGLIGGLFLFLAYFGTDQSQVGRYIGAKDTTESRLGLIFNGMLKIPMQFIILYIGVLVFLFYQFHQPPVFHNRSLLLQAKAADQEQKIHKLEQDFELIHQQKKQSAEKIVSEIHNGNADSIENARNQWYMHQQAEKALRENVRNRISEVLPEAKVMDKDYVFINYVMSNLPTGLVGLLLAVVFLAAMSSTASELNALASTTSVDIFKRLINRESSEQQYVRWSKFFTLMWAVIAMLYASLANQAENLIQFVNIVGSLFYGTLLGIFLIAFFFPYVKATATFIAALVAECVILYLYLFQRDGVAFLHYNYISCLIVIILGFALQALFAGNSKSLVHK
jgi:SSS family solute:Na+ symporter